MDYLVKRLERDNKELQTKIDLWRRVAFGGIASLRITTPENPGEFLPRDLSDGFKILSARIEADAAEIARLKAEVGVDLTIVDVDSAYHNWLETNNILHTQECEQAFRESWRILSQFITGPEQQAVDWHIVLEAVADAADVDGISAGALQGAFSSHGLLVLHKESAAFNQQEPKP